MAVVTLAALWNSGNARAKSRRLWCAFASVSASWRRCRRDAFSPAFIGNGAPSNTIIGTTLLKT
jgi:hypothetical protein